MRDLRIPIPGQHPRNMHIREAARDSYNVVAEKLNLLIRDEIQKAYGEITS